MSKFTRMGGGGGGGGGVGGSPQIWLSAAGGWPSTTNGCQAATKLEYITNDVDIYHLAFATGADEFAQWTLGMPSDWDAGTLTAVFHWTYATGSADETVEWTIQGISFGDDDALDTAWGTAQAVSDAAIAAADEHISASSPAFTLAGTPAASERAHFRVYRDVSEDNLAGDALLIGVMLTFTRT